MADKNTGKSKKTNIRSNKDKRDAAVEAEIVEKAVTDAEDHPTTPIEELGTSTTKSKRRLRPAPVSIREQSAQAAAQADKPAKRSVLGFIARLPIMIIMWPLTMLFRYIIIPPLKFLNRFKVFRAIGYVLVPPFLRNSWRELRLVTWPGTRETYDLVVAVLIFSIIFGLIVAGVDWVLDKAFRELILNK